MRAEYEFLQLLPDEMIEDGVRLAAQLTSGQFGKEDVIASLSSAKLGFEKYRAAHPIYNSFESTVNYYKYFRGNDFFTNPKAIK